MDNAAAPPPTARFGPDRRYTLVAGLGAACAALAAVFTNDPQGRLLVAVATLLLLAYVLTDLLFATRLEADSVGVTVRSPLARAVLPWPQIESIRADSRVRFGLRATTLEVDAGAVLAVLSRRALGADPAEVADLVNAFRPR